MCFSAESSFTSAALLGVITYACAQKVTSKKQYPFLSLIVFLAVMQLIEGFEWLAFEHNFYPSFFLPLGAYYFLLVGYFVWPIGLPFSFFMVEQKLSQKLKLKWLTIIVLLASMSVIIYKIVHPITPFAQIVNQSIQYNFSLFEFSGSPPLFGFAFVSITFFATLFSTLNFKWILFVLNVITYSIAAYFYSYAFTSVWCFFATSVAASIYFILDRNPIKN